MKKKKNMAAKIVAGIALGAIIIWIVGTGILFIVSSLSAPSEQEISQEDLQKLMDSLPKSEADKVENEHK